MKDWGWNQDDRLDPQATAYQEYNPDSAGTRRDECLVGDSHRQVLVDGDKELKWFKGKLRGLRVNQLQERTRQFNREIGCKAHLIQYLVLFVHIDTEL